jgi:phosphoribosylformimino-5-aminoimidazole carboxamide ribotide isomerase
MILFPAIDVRGGNAVRLRQGRFEDETVYADSPLEAARDWVQAGARYLHVVDLDGAKTGEPAALEHLGRIASELGVPVQYGGGLRTTESVRAAFEAGAARAIIGTAAFRDMDFLDACVAEFGTRVAVAVDVRGGMISTAGWTETSSLPAVDAIERLQDRGVGKFIYTDADRDGMLEGPSMEDVRAVADAVRGYFIVSGGIGSLEHLEALAALRQVNMAGVIVGKALYERKFSVAEARAALGG